MYHVFPFTSATSFELLMLKAECAIKRTNE